MEGEATATTLDWITTGADNILLVFDKILDIISGNPLLAMLFVAGTVIPAGFGIFHHFKHAG